MKINAIFLSLLFVFASANDIKKRLSEFRRRDGVSREEVHAYLSDRHQRRMEKLEELLEERKQSVEDHSSGRRLLSSEEHAKVTRQLDNFQRKLDQMTSISEEAKKEMFEHEVDGFYAINSVEYLDFDIKGVDV